MLCKYSFSSIRQLSTTASAIGIGSVYVNIFLSVLSSSRLMLIGPLITGTALLTSLVVFITGVILPMESNRELIWSREFANIVVTLPGLFGCALFGFCLCRCWLLFAEQPRFASTVVLRTSQFEPSLWWCWICRFRLSLRLNSVWQCSQENGFSSERSK